MAWHGTLATRYGTTALLPYHTARQGAVHGTRRGNARQRISRGGAPHNTDESVTDNTPAARTNFEADDHSGLEKKDHFMLTSESKKLLTSGRSRFTKYVGLENIHVSITMKPTNSPTQGPTQPKKIRLNSSIWATFFPTADEFRWVWIDFI